jgi:transcriptional regulator with XRE-family HTH domain
MIRNRLKEIREEKKLSLRDLEKITEINYSGLNQFENGMHDLPIRKIIILCDKLNVSLDYLLYRSDERLTADQLLKKPENELTDTEKDFLSMIRRIENEKTVQTIKEVIDIINKNDHS